MLFDHGPEWRANDEEKREKRIRVGATLEYFLVIPLLGNFHHD